MVALTVLVVIFLVLLGVGVLIFAGFFIINKIFLHRMLRLMERYNKLSSTIHSINFFKIEILIKNDLPIKVDPSILKKVYKDVEDNSNKIHDNLIVISDEINIMNLKSASLHLKQTEKAIAKAEDDISIIKKQYDQYTSYGDAIDYLVQTYEDAYEVLFNFFNKKVIYARYFKPIYELFNSISQRISELPNYKLKFDFKQTTNSILDLRKKIKTLAVAMDGIVKFQTISVILKNTMDANEATISQSFRNIDSQDLQMLKKLQNNFKENYIKFMKAYLILDLNNAQKYAIAASNSAHQVSNFVFIHTTTKDLIDLSIKEIEMQTNTILHNKQNIKNSLDSISKYFIKDKVLTKTFKDIANDIDVIEKLSITSKAILSKTFSQKIDALKQIAVISKNIYDKKEEVKKSIESINETLSKIIQIVSDLNDLYIYFNQLLVFLKRLEPESKQTNDIEILIKNNIALLNEYAKMIIEQEHPDYKTISYNVIHMYQNVDQLSNRLKSTNLLKNYATKLYVYCNRYKEQKELTNQFEQATKLYKTKKYKDCIKQLICIAKIAKKK